MELPADIHTEIIKWMDIPTMVVYSRLSKNTYAMVKDTLRQAIEKQEYIESGIGIFNSDKCIMGSAGATLCLLSDNPLQLCKYLTCRQITNNYDSYITMGIVMVISDRHIIFQRLLRLKESTKDRYIVSLPCSPVSIEQIQWILCKAYDCGYKLSRLSHLV